MSGPRPSYAPRRNASGRGVGWAIAGIISGVVAVFLIPILFGPLGVVLGIVGLARGSRGPGIAAIIVGILGLVLGVVLAAFLYPLVTKGP